MTAQRSLIYYITAHGYGHGVRSCDIINALCKKDPDLNVVVVTDLPVDFLSSRINLPRDAYRTGSFDVGMVQLDSIRVDVGASLKRAEEMMSRRHELVQQEITYLKEVNADIVVSDIPSFPIEAAKKLGLPALAVGNFAWDWIYEEFAADDKRWLPIVDVFKEGYGQCDLLLRLPFSEPMAAFPRQKNCPLVSIPGKACREDIARIYGIDEHKTWALLSFSTLELSDEAVTRIANIPGYEFLTILPLEWNTPNFHAVDRHRFAFADVMSSADVVVSKPGYGIMSECVVNNKPMVYADRTDFREYPILEESVKKHMTHQHIPTADLYEGNLAPYLDRIKSAPPPIEPLSAGGDTFAAEAILSFLG